MRIALCGTPDQREVVYSDARFMFMAAGRRWGKTTTGRNRILRRCLTEPDCRYWYLTPTYAQLKDEFEALAYSNALRPVIKKSNLQPFPEIRFTNGSRVGYRTFERPHNLKGAGLDEVWVDESQDIPEDNFWPVVRPLISDKRGTLVLSGQFRGHDWRYEKFYLPGQPGPDSKRPLYRSWRFSSESGMMFQTGAGRAELETARQQMHPAAFAEQYLCIPTANQYVCYPTEQVERIIGGKRLASSTEPTLMGLDLGRVRDCSAIVVMARSGQVIHAERLPLGMEHKEQAKRAAHVARTFNATPVVDTTGGATGGHARPDTYVKFYREAMPNLRTVTWEMHNKERMIAALALAIMQQEVRIPAECQDLIREVKSYEARKKNGKYQYSAPDGQSDDLHAGLVNANWGRVSGWLPPINGVSLGRVMF